MSEVSFPVSKLIRGLYVNNMKLNRIADMTARIIYKVHGFLIKIKCPFVSDATFLKWRFKWKAGYPLDLENPKTFNEKLQWLKLNDIHPEYSRMVDKAGAKEFAASLIGEEYIIPTYGVWDRVEDIDWESLPDKFVIKTTADSGGVFICKDKNKFNYRKVCGKLRRRLERKLYMKTKEYPYAGVRPRIIAEAYMEDESGYELKDYKIFCFDGVPKMLFVASDRQNRDVDTKFDFFDLDWNHLPVRNGHENSDGEIAKPKNFDKMLDIARKLSAGIPHVRVDLYNCDGKIYFGEMTFFHFSGMVPFSPHSWDLRFGDMLKLPSAAKN